MNYFRLLSKAEVWLYDWQLLTVIEYGGGVIQLDGEEGRAAFMWLEKFKTNEW
jgi:hypothetical protein